MWTQQAAIDFCRQVEAIAPLHGYHVALTGGCLYAAPNENLAVIRKDLDLVFYRVRQGGNYPEQLLLDLITKLNLWAVTRHGNWLQKMTWHNRKIDMFFPEGFEDVPPLETRENPDAPAYPR